MARYPIESNFYASVSDAENEVTFAPTRSIYIFNRSAKDGNVPRFVELCEASAAVNDVKRPSRFEQQRDCLFPFRSEQQARLVGPEVA
jgi:hypothetical protein